jgi:hypothetical protein
MRNFTMIIGALALVAPTAANADFATSLVSQTNTTAFGSGNVTGAPDGGGRWLGNTSDPPQFPGNLTVFFANPLGNGAGADLRIYDVASSSNETFNVFVSTDNFLLTFLGEYSATNNLVDWDGLFSGPVHYVRLVNTSQVASADIDAVEGFYRFVNPAIPEPSTWAMLILGFGAVGAAMRSRRSQGLSLGTS